MEENKNQTPEGQQAEEQKPTNQPTEEKKEENSEPEVTVEALMAKIATLETRNADNRAALDKALKQNGELKKQYRETLTEAQKAKMDKEMEDEEQKAYVSELEQYKQKNEAMKRYMTVQGMPADLAEKAAEAEVSGDMEKLSEIQSQHSEMKLKAARAEWQKSIPQPQFGTGEHSSMTKEEILAIKDSDERVQAIARNQHLFKQN